MWHFQQGLTPAETDKSLFPLTKAVDFPYGLNSVRIYFTLSLCIITDFNCFTILPSSLVRLRFILLTAKEFIVKILETISFLMMTLQSKSSASLKAKHGNEINQTIKKGVATKNRINTLYF